jgi:hemolysin III
MRRVDHCVIFVSIAATYTPYAVLEGNAATGLWVLWLFAGAGVVISIAWLGMPRSLRAALYVAMGLSTTPLLFRLPAIIGWPRVVAHCVAAVLYISGAAVWARRWPDPAPSVFGFHEVFHLLVIAGVFTQYAVLLDVQWGR